MVAVEQLMANIGSLTGTSLLWAANQVTIRLQNTGSLASLMREVHPNADVRNAAGVCIDAVSANGSAVDLSRPLYDALTRLRSEQRRRRRLAATLPANEAKATASDILVSHDSVRFVTTTLKDFQRRGVGIVPATEEGAFFSRLKGFQQTMTALTQEYDKRLSTDRRGVWIVVKQGSGADQSGAAGVQTAARFLRRATRAVSQSNASAISDLVAAVPVGAVTLDPRSALPLSEAVSVEELPPDFVHRRLRTVTAEQWAEAVRVHAAMPQAEQSLGGASDGKDAPEAFLWPASLAAASPAPAVVLEISTDYPDSGPAIKYARDRRLRAAVALQASRRGFPGNLPVLAELLQVRQAYAQAIAEAKAASTGSAPLAADDCSYASLTLQPMMAKTTAAVRTLLQRVQEIANGPGAKERAALTRLLAAELDEDPGLNGNLPRALHSFDVARFTEAARAAAFNVSSEQTRRFFTYAHARRGVLTTAARMFGLRFAVVAAPSLGSTHLGAREEDREIDVCLQPHFAQALPVCEHSVVTPLDESAVSAEANSVPEAHRWHRGVEVIDVYAAADAAVEEGGSAASGGWTSAFTADARGDYIGRLYIDAFPRENKYKHMAMFPIKAGFIRWRQPSEADTEQEQQDRNGRALTASSRVRDRGEGSESVSAQRPEAALVCNFDPQGPMEHSDVVTLFHEFGHALHHLLGGRYQRYARFSGTSTETDFVEVPSQLNEAFAWDFRVLSSFAGRLRSEAELAALEEGASKVESIPDDLVDRMRSADAAGRALSALRQVYLSQVSLRLHSGEFALDPALEPRAAPEGRALVSPGNQGQQATLDPQGQAEPPAGEGTGAGGKCPIPGPPVSLTAAAAAIERASSPFPHTAGAHFVANFGHLTGYAAQYYAYSWSDVIVKDMLGPFEQAKNSTGIAAEAEAAVENAEAAVEGEEETADAAADGSKENADAGSLLAAKNPALRYVRDVLEAGGRADGDKIVKAFLGREFQYDAYERWLREGASAKWIA